MRQSVRPALQASACFVAGRHNPVIAQFYKHLVANGKKPKVAIVACIRKELTMINAMMRDNAKWREADQSS